MARTKKTAPKSFTYNLEFLCNGETAKQECNDIEEGLLAIKPTFVHTESYVIVYKNGEVIAERRLPLIKARMLFANPDFRMVFINNLLLK